MSIFIRLWLAMAVVLAVGGWFTVDLLRDEVKPNMRQAIEDTLADSANLAAVLIADDLKSRRMQSPEFEQKIRDWKSRELKANIWEIPKSSVSLNLYITDERGIVVYDSLGKAAGQDYSRWNDVWLTLHGHYGVRSTRLDPADPDSTVMHVAAPVMDGDRLIGVVTLAKPGASVQPFVERAQRQMVLQGLTVAGLALLLAGLLAWWLRSGIHRVSEYALNLNPDRKPLRFRAARELNGLVQSIDRMREELEGKAYVEHLVHTLAHELKSPLTAIRASAEILGEEIPEADRQRFSINIEQQAQQLHDLISRMLLLVRLERGQYPLEKSRIDWRECLTDVLQAKEAECRAGGYRIELSATGAVSPVEADQFWLTQAVMNVVDNALSFMPPGGVLKVDLQQVGSHVELRVANPGPAIPEYALDRIFERFYSLPNPGSGRKGTGIGLTLVREVMRQHGGDVRLSNEADGVLAVLTLPAA